MKEFLINIEKWIEPRNQRERIAILAYTLFVLYLIFSIFIITPYYEDNLALVDKIETSKNFIKISEKQIQGIINKTTQPPSPTVIKRHDDLKKKIVILDQELNQYSARWVTPSQMINVLKEMLADDQLSFYQLQNSSPTPVLGEISNIYSYTITMIFRGNYFNTLQYLKNLEKLPWDLHWDSLNYKVENYPNAEVTLTLHLFSTKGTLIDV